MIITILLLALALSFSVHLLFIGLHVTSETPERKKQFFYAFFISAILNTMLMTAISVVALKFPEMIQEVDLKMVLWLLSGLALLIALVIQVFVFVNVYRRAKNPKFYYRNFFGKKVYEKGVIKQYEFIAIFATLPVFLIIGAYFVARLINLILYGRI